MPLRNGRCQSLDHSTSGLVDVEEGQQHVPVVPPGLRADHLVQVLPVLVLEDVPDALQVNLEERG